MAKNEISFAGLLGLDNTKFLAPTSDDYPDGRYSGTVNLVTPETKTSKNEFTLRFKVAIAIDKKLGAPALRVNDLISFITSAGFSWAAANTFADLCSIAGADRDLAYKLCKSLNTALETGDNEGVRSSFLEMVEVAKTIPGTRVAANLVWVDVGEKSFANVKGSKGCQAYESAMQEIDPGVDTVDIEPLKQVQLNTAVAPAKKQRNFIQPSRA
jgi:hypothetical protein